MTPPDWVSGTRIRARVQTTPDGAKAHLGWHDSMLNVDCGFQRAADDTERCLPAGGANIGGSFWGDAACSVPLASGSPGCATPTYATNELTTTCLAVNGYETPYRYHVYGSLVAYAGANFWIGAGGATGCTQYANSASYAFFTYGAEVPASTFAPGNIVTE